jgi:hypothetical protein
VIRQAACPCAELPVSAGRVRAMQGGAWRGDRLLEASGRMRLGWIPIPSSDNAGFLFDLHYLAYMRHCYWHSQKHQSHKRLQACHFKTQVAYNPSSHLYSSTVWFSFQLRWIGKLACNTVCLNPDRVAACLKFCSLPNFLLGLTFKFSMATSFPSFHKHFPTDRPVSLATLSSAVSRESP